VLVAAAVFAAAQPHEKRVAPVNAGLRRDFERRPRIAVLAGDPARLGYQAVALKDRKATRGAVERSPGDAPEMAGQGRGTVLFSFSGHGFADKGENYLAAFEASSGGLAGYATGGVAALGFQHGQMPVPYEAGELSGGFLLGRAPGELALATAAAPPAGPPPATAQISPPASKKAKVVRDTGEYDIFNQVIKDAGQPNAAAKFLSDLDTWTQRYPSTDFQDVRAMYYVQAYAANNDAGKALDAARPLVDKGIDGLKDGLGNTGLVLVLLFVTSRAAAVHAAAGTAAPDQLATGDIAAQLLSEFAETYFASENKPASVTADQWAMGLKQLMEQAAGTQFQIALFPGTSILKKNPKDPAACAAAEEHFDRVLQQYPESGLLTVQRAQASFCQQVVNPAKAMQALYLFARAVSLPVGGVTGLSAADQKTYEDYLKRAYTTYHGSEDGLAGLKELAARSPNPPADFHIRTAREAAAER
jgi:hypothetical protein